MPWHSNEAIKDALRNLDDVLATEVEEGRCSVSSWRVMMVEHFTVKTVGSGTQSTESAKLIAEAAMTYYEAHQRALNPSGKAFKKKE